MSNATTPTDLTALPGTRKVTVGALSGAATTVIVWLLKSTLKFEIPGDVATALGSIVTAILVYTTTETHTFINKA